MISDINGYSIGFIYLHNGFFYLYNALTKWVIIINLEYNASNDLTLQGRINGCLENLLQQFHEI